MGIKLNRHDETSESVNDKLILQAEQEYDWCLPCLVNGKGGKACESKNPTCLEAFRDLVGKKILESGVLPSSLVEKLIARARRRQKKRERNV